MFNFSKSYNYVKVKFNKPNLKYTVEPPWAAPLTSGYLLRLAIKIPTHTFLINLTSNERHFRQAPACKSYTFPMATSSKQHCDLILSVKKSWPRILWYIYGWLHQLLCLIALLYFISAFDRWLWLSIVSFKINYRNCHLCWIIFLEKFKYRYLTRHNQKTMCFVNYLINIFI